MTFYLRYEAATGSSENTVRPILYNMFFRYITGSSEGGLLLMFADDTLLTLLGGFGSTVEKMECVHVCGFPMQSKEFSGIHRYGQGW